MSFKKLSRDHKVQIAIAFVVALLLPLGMHFHTMYTDQQNRIEDREREEQQAIPRLVFESDRIEGEDSVVKFNNPSPVTPVSVSVFRFRVTDPATLEKIARIEPRPTDMPKVGSPNPADSVYFQEGEWLDSNTYQFSISVGYHVKPKDVNDFRLAIVNKKWAGMRFVGTLEIEYYQDGAMTFYTKENVAVKARRHP